nr:immunoglobulin light chain junction region [Macaca mulatta]
DYYCLTWNSNVWVF